MWLIDCLQEDKVTLVDPEAPPARPAHPFFSMRPASSQDARGADAPVPPARMAKAEALASLGFKLEYVCQCQRQRQCQCQCQCQHQCSVPP